jgi:hypothetical protein
MSIKFVCFDRYFDKLGDRFIVKNKYVANKSSTSYDVIQILSLNSTSCKN